MEKEINIVVPEGYEIDKENSTFECIKFKPIQSKKRWRDDEDVIIRGYYINGCSEIASANCHNNPSNFSVFATEKQARSALAMARISQIMANDKRFGGVVTDEEWKNTTYCKAKYTIFRGGGKIVCNLYYDTYHFLAFHTPEQRELFLQENEDLIKDYLMISLLWITKRNIKKLLKEQCLLKKIQIA